MTSRITLIKSYRNRETLRLMVQQEVADMIRSGEYEQQVAEFRRDLPRMTYATIGNNGTIEGYENWPKDLPRICFALEQENRNHELVTRGYTGLVLLEVNNLTGNDEAEAVRRGAGEMPQTLMAFVGADGQSVKIVCKGELFPEDGSLFHENLYERARLIYNGQLGVTVEKLEPLPQRICYMSYDPQLVYNPLAIPIYAKAEKPTVAISHQSYYGQTVERSDRDLYRSMHTIFEFNLTKAYDDTEGIADREERSHATLSRLAQYCLETGIPMAVAQRQAVMKSDFWDERELVMKVFENAYREEHVRKYMERKGIQRTKTIPPETLLTMKINLFLNANYELRKNVMRGVAEYRMRTGVGFSFQDLTEEARNSITMRALEQCIRCWDKDIRRYVNSDDIQHYDPVNDYLEHLPRWDGKDRVTALAERVPTEWTDWTHLFHIWMRSMVAMWLGKGQLTGNALVPLLIGRQGCGKSSFCRNLLPRDLLDYNNDRINFKNEHDLNLGLTSFALINLDEFDKITQRQQIVLKYLVSTSDLKYRPPYGKAYSSHRHYASFIGTTNESMPLIDPIGNRRFICVNVEADIDFTTPVEYDQLYAQLEHEVSVLRLRYHLTREEESALMEHNLRYQRLSQLGEQLLAVFEKPDGTPQTNPSGGKWMTLKEISARLKQLYKSAYQEDESSYVKIGNFLSRPEYKFISDRKASGMVYWLKERQLPGKQVD